jgi:hypothetical protein
VPTSSKNGLQLLPLAVGWDRQTAECDWENAPDGSRLVHLPFGKCRMIVQPDRDEPQAHRVECVLRCERPVRLDFIETRYHPPFARSTWAWTPYLRPTENDIIADAVFRSPAVVIGDDAQAFALMPDLAAWPARGGTYLDFIRDNDSRSPSRLAHGIGAWRTRAHIFFSRRPAQIRLAAGDELRWAHYVVPLAPNKDEALVRVAAFLWRRFARRGDTAPQALPFAELERAAIGRIFAPDLFHEFTHDGRAVAGMITQTVTARRRPRVMDERGVQRYVTHQRAVMRGFRFLSQYVFTNRVGYRLMTAFLHTGRLKIAPMVSFQTWFNQARTAVGSALHAARIGDAARAAQAAKIIELALAAPMEHGCLPTVCFFPNGRTFWKRGTRVFEPIDAYSLPDAATTGFHLLEWYERIAADPRILLRCRRLAEFFRGVQAADGSFPTWIHPTATALSPDACLERSASTAAPAMFLARLNRLSPDERDARAVRAALDFIRREVMPDDRWFDAELWFSCAGRVTGQDGPDAFTGCYPANTLGLYWTARAALDLHLATGEGSALALARHVAARLSLFQQVHDHPHISIDTFGGFAVMNADAEFNDARQGVFVPLYLDLYAATGEPEMIERGIAALRASFTTMLIEENRPFAPGNLVRYREADRGAVVENYGHTGRDEPTAGYLAPDWGGGSSLYASGMAFRQIGQVHVDPDRQTAHGVDLCTAQSVRRIGDEVHVAVSGNALRRLEVTLAPSAHEMKRLIVNERAAEPLPNQPRRFVVQFPEP